jgi:membrane protease YdiL (CAAX protease family)
MTDVPSRASFPPITFRSLALFLAAFYAAWTLRVVLLMPVESGISAFWVRQGISQSVRILLWGLPVFLMLAYVHRVSPFRALKLDTFPRGRALRDTAVLCAGWLVVTALFGAFVEQKALVFSTRPSLAEWGAMAVTIIWAPIFEEVLFRGYVYQALRGHMRWFGAALISGFMFAAAHWPGWLFMQGPHIGLVAQTVSITIIGIVLAAAFERGQSLWPCIVLHTLNNVLWA